MHYCWPDCRKNRYEKMNVSSVMRLAIIVFSRLKRKFGLKDISENQPHTGFSYWK